MILRACQPVADTQPHFPNNSKHMRAPQNNHVCPDISALGIDISGAHNKNEKLPINQRVRTLREKHDSRRRERKYKLALLIHIVDALDAPGNYRHSDVSFTHHGNHNIIVIVNRAVSYLKLFKMPHPVKITGRSSSITNSFINSIIPIVAPPCQHRCHLSLAVQLTLMLA